MPTVTIADVLQWKQVQRFDLMAIPSCILGRRRSAAGQVIVDVRLVDGSTNPSTETLAAMPLTLFFQNDAEFADFEPNI